MFSENESRNEEVEQEMLQKLRADVVAKGCKKLETHNEVKVAMDEMVTAVHARWQTKKWRRATQSSPKPKQTPWQ